MSRSTPLAALVVGAVSLDREPGAGVPNERAGGVVHYAGVAFARLGARARVVTSVAPQDAARLLAALHAEGVETAARASRATTTYVNDYSGPVDRHELIAASDPIGPDDVPRDWRASDVVQLGPLHRRDLEPGLAEALSGWKGLDVQGLVRSVGPGGTRLAPSPELARFLPHVAVLKASEAELEAVLDGDPLERFVRRHDVREMLVTRGARGVDVILGDRHYPLAAPRVEPRYKVGAGDVFLAAYLWFRAHDRGPVDAARAATQVCAVKLEQGEVPKGLAAV
jgi:sugar/nucleoside kinase (ribokinase family)